MNLTEAQQLAAHTLRAGYYMANGVGTVYCPKCKEPVSVNPYGQPVATALRQALVLHLHKLCEAGS